MSQRDDFGSFLSGFVFGGMIGAVVALLMAPQSGEETRTYLKEKGIEVRDSTVAGAEEALRRAEAMASETRVRAESAAAEVRARTEELTQMAKDRGVQFRDQSRVVLEEQRAKIGGVIDKVRPAKEAAAPAAEEAPKPKKKTATKKK